MNHLCLILSCALLSACSFAEADQLTGTYLLVGQSNMVLAGPAMESALPHATLIQAAVGGTSITQWQKGGPLYAKAVEMVGQKHVTAILWHQGEQDAYGHTTPAEYERLLTQLFTDLRADIGDVPIVAGEIGRWLKFPSLINDSIHAVADSLPAISVVSSAGLIDDGDLVHFNPASRQELAHRYAALLR